MIPALEALQRLREGNRRFVEGMRSGVIHSGDVSRSVLLESQSPIAVVLGCSDSRVPVELVFNQGFGDLFVIRVAGNIVAPSQIGSIEFAAEKFGTKLVVVLGHTGCGAIEATLDQLQRATVERSRNLQSIVDRIRPAVAGLMHTELRDNHDLLRKVAGRTNVSMSANFLRHGSVVIEQMIAEGELLVVGAEYSLETGMVDFFDGVPVGQVTN
ncbi:MAG: carbonic anhydrase [Pseudomonadota bacterium]|nr:carbonic anhydrase [Pseudomonadota bacterium]